MTTNGPDMTCAEARTAASDLVDGTIADGTRTRLRAHLDNCPACRALAADVQQIVEEARTLERPAPPEALWQRIAEHIRDDPAGNGQSASRGASSPDARTSWWWLGAAAAVVLIVAGLWSSRIPGPDTTIARLPASEMPASTPLPAGRSTDSEIVTIEQELRQATARYERAVTSFEMLGDRDRVDSTMETTVTMRASLQVVDRAILESRTALDAEPMNEPAQESLFEALRRKAELLHDAVILINEMLQGHQEEAADVLQNLNRNRSGLDD